jgi:hypothetical protein
MGVTFPDSNIPHCWAENVKMPRFLSIFEDTQTIVPWDFRFSRRQIWRQAFWDLAFKSRWSLPVFRRCVLPPPSGRWVLIQSISTRLQCAVSQKTVISSITVDSSVILFVQLEFCWFIKCCICRSCKQDLSSDFRQTWTWTSFLFTASKCRSVGGGLWHTVNCEPLADKGAYYATATWRQTDPTDGNYMSLIVTLSRGQVVTNNTTMWKR